MTPLDLRRLCVFCGSNRGTNPAYLRLARGLGASLARAGRGVVYGGGSVGLMGAVADAALEAGGEVIGVIPQALEERELGHRGVTRLEVVGTMHERKARMAALADGFIALPGGMGTLDEFCEIVTWAQLGIHRKPMGLLDTDGYFEGFLRFFDHMTQEGFVQPAHRRMVQVESDPERLLALMASYEAPDVKKWTDLSKT